jgi:hypothetical protein
MADKWKLALNGNVRYRLSEGGRPLTLTGIKSLDQVHTFSYHGGSIGFDFGRVNSTTILLQGAAS